MNDSAVIRQELGDIVASLQSPTPDYVDGIYQYIWEQCRSHIEAFMRNHDSETMIPSESVRRLVGELGRLLGDSARWFDEDCGLCKAVNGLLAHADDNRR